MARPQDVPNLSAKHLRAMVALAQFGSFVAAAAHLRISQPGLSRIIQQAERLLGVALFARGTRTVFQTAAGREFIPAAERLLGELSQQTRRLRALDGQMRGQIIIASLMSISHHVLPAALVAFRQEHPKLHIHLREGLGSGVLEDVRSGYCDFGIGYATGLPDGITAGSVTEESCYVVLPRGHRLAGRSPVRVGDLAGEPMISMPSDSGLRRTIDAAANTHEIALDHSIIINQYASLFEFVTGGLGISIVPASALPPVGQAPAVVARPLRPAITRRIGILHLAERPLSPGSQAFLALFRPRFLAATRRRAGRGG
jgi:LysR family transcriptional regulator, carnitine catabolism transcriptional activator